ncbi:hypothetical protein AHAS_Ahas01G0177900 [Arachis hypogaea]
MLLSLPSQPPRIEGPSRSCGSCASNGHYTDECPQIQKDNTLAVENPYPQRSNFNQGNQGSYHYGGNQGKGGETTPIKDGLNHLKLNLFQSISLLSLTFSSPTTLPSTTTTSLPTISTTNPTSCPTQLTTIFPTSSKISTTTH